MRILINPFSSFYIMIEKHTESLRRAVKKLQIADHIVYVTYPIVKDKRLLLKALEIVYESSLYLINAILQHDYLWKKIGLYTDSRLNLKTFFEKCAPRYNISKEELAALIDILSAVEAHKKSPLEFQRENKVVILSESLKTKIIDLEKMKNYIFTTRKLIEKANTGMKH